MEGIGNQCVGIAVYKKSKAGNALGMDIHLVHGHLGVVKGADNGAIAVKVADITAVALIEEAEGGILDSVLGTVHHDAVKVVAG